MHLRIYEVDVPMHDTTDPARCGVHVFTGVADSPAAALRRAHEVYGAALAAHTAGLEIPGKQPDRWGASGLRPGREMEWPAARASRWHNSVSWTIRSDFAL
ncbi:hypothetical protein EYS09_15015 [Streptomyces kasugaensis]|uniref:Uncharacterized protein n=1 Tax=Streptomyces kasugaensis TaxID=1946 RepID=A0A4Q9HWH6_STRKA|nr:hypothetical protein [Streptomyces kasugaensis]TBO58889.1 hypothetical protein EYS09_15015 [Streptomyces kasugaensis]